MIVAGVNHVKTKRARYTSLALVGLKKLTGIGGVNDEDFEGSANAYMPDDAVADYLYAYTFARNCKGKGKYCYEVVS